MHPPIRFSSQLIPTEEITLSNGYKILKEQSISINMTYLQNNPEHWQRPLEYIPERFDPNSPFYLRPDGKKRHPMCFGPFLGGKRICLGKTFAESAAKCVLALNFGQLDFTFVDEKVRNEKPPNTLTH